MSEAKMHPDEVPTSPDLVRRLLRAQFPQWANLPIAPVGSYGTDHAIYRVGAKLSVRLPRIAWAIHQVEKEMRWLPELAPRLPLAVPVPLAKGEPGEGYPYGWSVSPWFAGNDATEREHIHDLATAASQLGGFVSALRQIETEGGPRPGRKNFFRGVPLALMDERVRASISEWDGELDTAVLTRAWDAALAAPVWDAPGVWIHGDLLPGNVIVQEGRLAAVIDFGCLGVGDPACDLVVGWALFTGESQAAFREAAGIDDATWARGRGWAVTSVGVLPYYRHTNPGIVARARRQLEEVINDVTRGG